MKLFLILSGLLHPAAAWWDFGHQLPTAMVRELAKKQKATVTMQQIEKVEKLDRWWMAMGDWGSPLPMEAQFEFMAAMPDYMKNDDPGKGMDRAYSEHIYDALHYFNPPYDIEADRFQEIKKEDLKPDVTLSGVVWALHNNYKLLTAKKEANRWTAVSWMRLFWTWVHFLGDVHQPMHLGGIGYSSCFQLTDTGGNKITLKPATNATSIFAKMFPTGTNLHALWDSMMWLTDELREARTGYVDGYGNYSSPIGKKVVGKNGLLLEDAPVRVDARKLMEDFKKEDLASWAKDMGGNQNPWKIEAGFDDWAMESFRMAQQVVYNASHFLDDYFKGCDFRTGLHVENNNCKFGCKWDKNGKFKYTPQFTPNDEYLTIGNDASRRRVAMSGYRLDHMLKPILELLPTDEIIKYAEDNLKHYHDKVMEMLNNPLAVNLDDGFGSNFVKEIIGNGNNNNNNNNDIDNNDESSTCQRSTAVALLALGAMAALK